MRSFLYFSIALASVLALLALAVVPVGMSLALDFAVVSILAVVVLGYLPGKTARLFFVTFCAWVVVRYIAWRFDSLPLDGSLIASAGALLLLMAELYGVSMLLLGLFVNAWPLERAPSPLPRDQAQWPTVDVFIPTYSESLEVVAPTVMGAVEIDYPRDKLRVYVLDDGWPRSQSSQDPEQRIRLAERTEQLKALCAQHGATWLTREDNQHAKSGNMNSALKHTSGELVLVLDADHVPTRDIVKNMAGAFLRDSKLAFVQSPHFFLNADPLEKNLNLFNRIPAENDMFYRRIQKGLDLWNTSFFCGSAALLRRSALEEVGGFSTDSITEDASTSVKMHQRGWRSAYVSVPMVAGLQPETFAGFVVQRLRWAMGMVQIMVKQNPLLVRGLSAAQRLSYLSVVMFWLFPLARTVFFIAPLLSIFFNLTVYPVGIEYFLAYTVPYLVAVLMSFERTFGRTRAILTSEVYETLQSFYILPAIFSTMFRPNAPTFKVTPKGEKLDREFISELRLPFYVFYAIVTAGLVWGCARLVLEPEIRQTLWLSVGWLVFNFVLLSAALGTLLERPQRRARPRVGMQEEARLHEGDKRHRIIVRNMNETSAMVRLVDERIDWPQEAHIKLADTEVRVRRLDHRYDGRDPKMAVYLFMPDTPEQQRALVTYAYGSSKRWSRIWEGRTLHPFFIFTMFSFSLVALRGAWRHFSFLSRRQDEQ